MYRQNFIPTQYYVIKACGIKQVHQYNQPEIWHRRNRKLYQRIRHHYFKETRTNKHQSHIPPTWQLYYSTNTFWTYTSTYFTIISHKIKCTSKLKSASLLSIRQLCDSDCSALFTKKDVNNFNSDKTTVLNGIRNTSDGLWDVTIKSSKT